MPYLCSKFRYWDETNIKNLLYMEGTEKIYCTDRGSDAMAYLAGMNGQRGTDPMAMAAMMNGGMNGMWNNPLT